MVGLIIKVFLKLALLTVALAAVEVTTKAVALGPAAYAALPSVLIRRLIGVLTMPLTWLVAIVQGVLGGLKKIVLSIFDAVIGVVWSVVPGVSVIPRPKVSDIL